MRTITYAIADIHGRADLLDDLLAQVEADAAASEARAKIVFTGDYVDRGPDSAGVIERLMAGPARSGDEFLCLRGNHDELLVQAVKGTAEMPLWAQQLHEYTLSTYRMRAAPQLLERHVAFLAALPLTHDDGTHLFVHAGIRPGVPLDKQTEQDLLWIRHEFLDYSGPLPRRVVHGHTIVGDRPVVSDNRISLDTGAYRSGILTAAVIDGGALRFLATAGAPDKDAILREARIVALVQGRPLNAPVLAAFDAFMAGRITAAAMMAVVEGR